MTAARLRAPEAVRGAYRAGAHGAAAAVHRAVLALEPRVPVELGLKHTYDWQVLDARPDRVAFRVPAAVARRPGEGGVRATAGHARRWLAEGGAWKSARRHPSRNLHGRFVLGGDWDLAKRPFAPPADLVDMLRHGLPAAETREYRKMRAAVEAGDFRWTKGCRTVADVDAYFARLRALYEDVRTGGYRSQRDLGLDGDDEIRVCVDRDARLCVIGGGTHRLSIARMLDVERVPVVVKRVHQRWVGACLLRYGGDVRQAVARGLEPVLTG